MDPLVLAILIAAVLFIALLYSSVGHGGGSGYIAALALVGFGTVRDETNRPGA